MSVRRGDLLPSSNSTSLPDEPHRRQQPFKGHELGTAGTKQQSAGVGKPADGVPGGKAAAEPNKQMSGAAIKHSEAPQKQAGSASKAREGHELHLQAFLGPACAYRLSDQQHVPSFCMLQPCPTLWPSGGAIQGQPSLHSFITAGTGAQEEADSKAWLTAGACMALSLMSCRG